MDAVLKRIDSLEKEIKEQKKYTESVILNNTALLNQIANSIEVKLDLLCNIEKKPEAKPAAKKAKPTPKKQYFTTIFKTNPGKYMNELYTSDELEKIHEDPDVKSKKTDTQKINRVVDILYTNLINDDASAEKLKTIYEEYKKSVEEEDIAVTAA